jgi:hypothetical protein
MPKIKEITVTHDQLVKVSCRISDLLNLTQGSLEWVLFRALSDELGVDLFELEPDECSCGDKKRPGASMCDGCAKYAERNSGDVL